MNQEQLKERTKQYALRVIKLVKALPKIAEGQVIGQQLLRSGTSVGANYRAACRARTKTEFISKIGIVVEETDESGFWLELIIESKLMNEKQITPLLKETNEILAIMVSTRISAQKNK